MPLKVTCADCKHILYKGDILKSPEDIKKKFDGNCPNCNRKLVFNIKRLRIYPYKENDTQKRKALTEKEEKGKHNIYFNLLNNLSAVLFDDIKEMTKLSDKELEEMLEKLKVFPFVEFYKKEGTEYIGLTTHGYTLVGMLFKEYGEQDLLDKYTTLPENYQQLLKQLYKGKFE